MSKYFALFCLILCCSTLKGQDLSFQFKAVVLDSDTNEPVAFATIQVLNRRKGMATKPNGQFSFQALLNDEIKISSIGYQEHVFMITEEYKDLDKPFKIYLTPRTYLLDSVEVIHWSDQFYLKRPIWDTLKFDNPFQTDNPTDWTKTNIIPNSDGNAGFAITGFLNSFDKDLRQKKYLQRFKEAEKFQLERKAQLERKFNKTFVKEITDIDDRVLDEFMAFCNFRDGEILRATEYELTLMILRKYEAFLIR